ncbi:alpha/beta fold hydrolase [Actinoplanes sp. NPDC048796]|uniref:thioesterase II family protein n=1 Tax=unclassified Actinoplanes TaxID=2626549 RepID=UPI0033D093D2
MTSLPLLCLPYAGAGASAFRGWSAFCGPGLEIVPVQLPGREELIDEEPYRDAGRAADGLLPGIRRRLGDHRAVALFGHSMGALLAYEVACRLAALPGMTVSLLVVSASHAPGTSRRHTVTGLPDDEFLDGLRRYAGYWPAALDDPDFRELMLPVLRADAELHERHRPDGGRRLSAPVLAVRGADDPMVERTETARWAEWTSGPFTSAELPGGHMDLVNDPAALLRLISDAGSVPGDDGHRTPSTASLR